MALLIRNLKDQKSIFLMTSWKWGFSDKSLKGTWVLNREVKTSKHDLQLWNSFLKNGYCTLQVLAALDLYIRDTI